MDTNPYQKSADSEEYQDTNASDNSIKFIMEENDTDTTDSCANDEYNQQLQTRIMALRDTIQMLKSQLHEEREIWRREMEERRENDYISKATEMGYQYYGDNRLELETDLRELKYPDQLLQSHYEHRQNLQKQIAVANYKRRLLEVENMCNLELLRVKQSVQILQPLQLMCSEWKFPDEAGDAIRESSADVKTDITDEEKLKHNNNSSEISMPLEVLVQKVDKKDDVAAFESSQSQPCLSDISQVTDVFGASI